MKFYDLFLKTLFFLNIFTSGVPLDEMDELKRDIYSSYEEHMEKLKTNGLEFLVNDLDKLYELTYEFLTLTSKLYGENQELFDYLDNARYNTHFCVDKNLIEAINNYKYMETDMIEILEKIPDKPTCYKDLKFFFDNIKLSSRESLANDETLEKAEKFYWGTEEIFGTLYHIYEKDFDMWKKQLILLLGNYVEDMVYDKQKKKKLKTVSKNLIDHVKHIFHDFVEYNKEEGCFNKDIVKNVTKKYEEVESICRGMPEEVYSAAAVKERLILNDIAIIKKYASAKFYIVDDENNKKELDCEDHVPYSGKKPTESVISYSQNGKRVTFYVMGTDEIGQKYKRKFICDDVISNRTTVNEIYEYDDRVVNRKYIIEFYVLVNK